MPAIQCTRCVRRRRDHATACGLSPREAVFTVCYDTGLALSVSTAACPMGRTLRWGRPREARGAQVVFRLRFGHQPITLGHAKRLHTYIHVHSVHTQDVTSRQPLL